MLTTTVTHDRQSIHTNPSLCACVDLSCHQSTAPFLHLGALAVFTALGWLVAGYVVRRERSSKCVMGLQLKWRSPSCSCVLNMPSHVNAHLWCFGCVTLLQLYFTYLSVSPSLCHPLINNNKYSLISKCFFL